MLDNIRYIEGDATKPYLKHEDKAYNYLIHVCNNVGAWGAGFVIPLAKKWPSTKEAYHQAIKSMKLGENQIVVVEENLAVVNMIAQLNVVAITHEGRLLPNLQYDALFHCLEDLGNSAHPNSRFHFPMFGAGLAGGDWDTIAALINSTLSYRYETWCYVFDEKWKHLCKRDPLTNPMVGDKLKFGGICLEIKERDNENVSWIQTQDVSSTTAMSSVEAFVSWVTGYSWKGIK